MVIFVRIVKATCRVAVDITRVVVGTIQLRIQIFGHNVQHCMPACGIESGRPT